MEILSKIKESRKRLAGAWAIEENSFKDIVSVYSKFEDNPKSFIEAIGSDKDPGAFGDLFSSESEEILIIKDNEAIINIVGPLVDSHDCATIFFGCTSYEDIIDAISRVEKMDNIESVIFNIDSPGGMVTGCDNAAIAIKSMDKPSEAKVGAMAASAAYWLASQCDSITATCATASFGSIGVVIEYWDNSRAMNDNGMDKVCITSTGAPNKRLDALSEEGRLKIKADLDAIESIFHRRVADGRGVGVSDVGANFGQGGMFLAEKSLKAGMIDKTDFILNNNINSKEHKNKPVGTKMNLKDLLAKNPEAESEVNALVSAAVDKANDENSSKEKSQKEVVEKASKYLTSNYDDKIKALAIETIKGNKSIDVLTSVVEFQDKANEEKSSENAKTETDKLPETPPSSDISSNGKDGDIVDEESYQSSVERIKKLR